MQRVKNKKLPTNNLNICVTNIQVLKRTISLSTDNICFEIYIRKIDFNYTLLSGGLVFIYMTYSYLQKQTYLKKIPQ